MTRPRFKRHRPRQACLRAAIVLCLLLPGACSPPPSTDPATSASISPRSTDTASAQTSIAFAQFVDVRSKAGIDYRNRTGNPGDKPYIVESMGSGVAFLDYDGDGDMDLYFSNGSTFSKDLPSPPPENALYRNNADGTFTDVTKSAGVGDTGWGGGIAVADIDNDFDPDIFLTNIGPNVLYRNNGDGTFTDISARAGVADPGFGSSAAFLDFDLDGYLDLYVTNYVDFDWEDPPENGKDNALCQWHGVKVYCGPRGLPRPHDILYRNKGNGTFEDVSEKAGIRKVPACYGLGVVAGDLNDDGWPDIYVANDATPNLLFTNNGDGTFTEIGLEAGVSHSDRGKEQAGMGVDLGDYNNDGRPDLFVTNYSEDSHALYRNESPNFFVNLCFESRIAELSYIDLAWGTHFIDVDNNGLVDLFCANGHVYPQADLLTEGTGMTYLQENSLFQNQDDGTFADISDQSGPAFRVKKGGRGSAYGDFDDDGDLDIVINEIDDYPTLMRNDGGNRNHWIKFWLVGRKANADAYGAKIMIRADGMKDQHHLLHPNSSYLSSCDPRVHFGLGSRLVAGKVVIQWPGGGRTELTDLAADRLYIVDETAGIIGKRPFSSR